MYPSPNITCCRTVQLARCCRSASASAAAHSASNAGDSFRAFATFAARLAALRISSALASRVMAVLPVLRYHPNDNAYRDNRGADDCQPLRARVLPVANNPTTHQFADKRGLLR